MVTNKRTDVVVTAEFLPEYPIIASLCDTRGRMGFKISPSKNEELFT